MMPPQPPTASLIASVEAARDHLAAQCDTAGISPDLVAAVSSLGGLAASLRQLRLDMLAVAMAAGEREAARGA